jgi:hypothetical protein
MRCALRESGHLCANNLSRLRYYQCRMGFTDDTSFHSFFGPAYSTLMPILAVDILQVGATDQDLLMGEGSVGSLSTSL